MLCLNVFKDRRKDNGERSTWIDEIIDFETLKKILWFFRLGGDNLRSSLEDVYTEIVRSFALTMCKFIFEFRYFGNYAGEEDKKIQAMFRSVRPQVIEILYQLGRLDLLLSNDWKYDDLDFPSLLTLKELAMGYKVELRDCHPSHRLPETLEEAVAGGSQAARVLHTLLTIGKERKRLRKKTAIEQKREEMERELEKLKI
jgi:hypothetical protein